VLHERVGLIQVLGRTGSAMSFQQQSFRRGQKPMRPIKSIAAVLLVTAASVIAKEPLVPAQAEQALDMWLTAFNGGKREDLQAFMKRYKLTYDVQDDLDFKESMGKFTLLNVKSSTPHMVKALLLSEAADKTLLATITIDPKDQSKVDKFQFEGVETPAQFKPKRMEMQSLLSATTSRLNSLEETGKLSGTFLVAREGDVLLEWSGGYADRQHKVAVDKTTKFRLASLNKMFTAIAILQLSEAGKLSLDESIGKYLKNYPNQAIASSITIRQLLNHTSGTGDIFTDEYARQSESIRTLSDYWKLFAATPLKFKPGAEDGYSNYGYILLGTVIESVSGQSYYDYVDKHIYRVAGMTSSGSEPESLSVKSLAIPYTRVAGGWKQDSASLPWRGTSAGGGYSTVGDLLKFANALRSGKLVSMESFNIATRPQNHKVWYGYGFMVEGSGNERQYGHEGGASGGHAAFLVLPSKEYVVVGLSNFDPSTMANMVNFVSHRLPL
jgi:D-alanyl-D-alanine carboxypeptidase